MSYAEGFTDALNVPIAEKAESGWELRRYLPIEAILNLSPFFFGTQHDVHWSDAYLDMGTVGSKNRSPGLYLFFVRLWQLFVSFAIIATFIIGLVYAALNNASVHGPSPALTQLTQRAFGSGVSPYDLSSVEANWQSTVYNDTLDASTGTYNVHQLHAQLVYFPSSVWDGWMVVLLVLQGIAVINYLTGFVSCAVSIYLWATDPALQRASYKKLIQRVSKGYQANIMEDHEMKEAVAEDESEEIISEENSDEVSYLGYRATDSYLWFAAVALYDYGTINPQLWSDGGILSVAFFTLQMVFWITASDLSVHSLQIITNTCLAIWIICFLVIRTHRVRFNSSLWIMLSNAWPFFSVWFYYRAYFAYDAITHVAWFAAKRTEWFALPANVNATEADWNEYDASGAAGTWFAHGSVLTEAFLLNTIMTVYAVFSLLGLIMYFMKMERISSGPKTHNSSLGYAFGGADTEVLWYTVPTFVWNLLLVHAFWFYNEFPHTNDIWTDHGEEATDPTADPTDHRNFPIPNTFDSVRFIPFIFFCLHALVTVIAFLVTAFMWYRLWNNAASYKGYRVKNNWRIAIFGNDYDYFRIFYVGGAYLPLPYNTTYTTPEMKRELEGGKLYAKQGSARDARDAYKVGRDGVRRVRQPVTDGGVFIE